MNKLRNTSKKEPAAPAQDIVLLTEIRDLLVAQNNNGGNPSPKKTPKK
jgi:hypothetical protein